MIWSGEDVLNILSQHFKDEIHVAKRVEMIISTLNNVEEK